MNTEATSAELELNRKPLVAVLADESISSREKYMHIFVGRQSVAALLRYELVMGFLASAPGALGYFLRARTYPWLMSSCGRHTVFGRGVTLRSPGRISLGSGVIVDDFTVLDAKGESSSLTIGSSVLIGRGNVLSCSDGTIDIADMVSIGPFCFFASKSHLRIGSRVSVGSGSQLLAGGHSTADPTKAILLQDRVHQGITIEDNVWIGSGVIVLDGVTVGSDSILGAGSVVTKNVPPWSVVLGNPARVVQTRR